MKTSVAIQIDMEVEIDMSEERVLGSHHGWGNAIFHTWEAVDEQVKQAVIKQFTEQHAELHEEAKMIHPDYLSYPF